MGYWRKKDLVEAAQGTAIAAQGTETAAQGTETAAQGIDSGRGGTAFIMPSIE